MKLRKIAKYLDWIADVNLWIDEDVVWSGTMLEIHAAMDKNNDKIEFIKDLKNDGDFDTVKKIKEVEKFLDYKITGGEEFDAVSMRTSKRNNNIIILDINLKK